MHRPLSSVTMGIKTCTALFVKDPIKVVRAVTSWGAHASPKSPQAAPAKKEMKNGRRVAQLPMLVARFLARHMLATSCGFVPYCGDACFRRNFELNCIMRLM